MNTYPNYVHTSTVFKYILVGGFVHAFDEPVCVCMCTATTLDIFQTGVIFLIGVTDMITCKWQKWFMKNGQSL